MSIHEQLDNQAAIAALQKRQRGEQLNAKELAAIKRYDKRLEEKRRWEYYSSIPQKHWREMSGRQAKIINEQAALYGIPFSGASINLALVVRALHDFLAANGHKLLKEDADSGLLSGPPTEALERLRLVKAKREEFAYERDLGMWRRVDETQTALGVMAAILRQGIETLQRQFGPEARETIAASLHDAYQAMSAVLSGGSHGTTADGWRYEQLADGSFKLTPPGNHFDIQPSGGSPPEPPAIESASAAPDESDEPEPPFVPDKPSGGQRSLFPEE